MSLGSVLPEGPEAERISAPSGDVGTNNFADGEEDVSVLPRSRFFPSSCSGSSVRPGSALLPSVDRSSGVLAFGSACSDPELFEAPSVLTFGLDGF